VDDGSDDGTPERLQEYASENVRVLRLLRNQGRSAARNAGARESLGDVLVFIDCDCRPLNEGFLAAHLTAVERGYVGSVGHVIGTGGGFWDRYQRDASTRRERQHSRGYSYSGSSQNLAVLRSAFEGIGGFDVQYREYGFEDRDLLLRLSESGRIAWTNDATLQHLDALNLSDFSRKMTEAGQFTASRFANRHPPAYSVLGYSAIDARKRPWLRPIGTHLGPRMTTVASRLEPALHKKWMPYILAKGIVKIVVGISFLYGTTRATP
jgi:glycosyltransferase involved in cell wall biosynthesis